MSRSSWTLGLKRLLQLAQVISRAPVVLLVCQQGNANGSGSGDRYTIVDQVGWSFPFSAVPLAKPLFEQVHARFSRQLRITLGTIQSSRGVSSLMQKPFPFCHWAGVPLVRDGQMVGTLIFLDTQPLAHTPDQTDLLWVIAIQAVSGLKAANLVQPDDAILQVLPQVEPDIVELQATNVRLRHVSALSLWMQSCMTQAELFQSIVPRIQAAMPQCSGRILLSNPMDAQMTVAAQWGPWPSKPDHCVAAFCPVMQTGYQHSQCLHSCRGLEPHRVNGKNLASPLPSKAALPLLLADAHFCTPLMTLDSGVLGTLAFWHPHKEGLSEEWQRMGEAIAQQLALTLQRLQRIEELQQQSIRDPLTGLFNRRYLAEALPHLLRRACQGKHPLSVMLLDIDHFKRVNDQFGHAVGDQVLRDTSLFLKGFVRGTDIACRYGGEEFILVLPEASLQTAWERAERIRQGLRYIAMNYAGHQVGTITLSVGIATCPEHGDTADRLITAADHALYQSKLEGRDRVTLFAKTDLPMLGAEPPSH